MNTDWIEKFEKFQKKAATSTLEPEEIIAATTEYFKAMRAEMRVIREGRKDG